MESYFVLKLIHILSAVVVLGTGSGIAFFMLMAYLSKNIQAIAVTAKHVVLADWLFTAPAVVIQFVSGLLLMKKLGYPFSSTWFLTVMVLFLFVGFCWLPVLIIQYRLKHYADKSLEKGELLPELPSLMHLWVALGVPAFLAMLVILWLMIFKPFPLF